MTAALRLADLLNDALPQTQCTRCGYADCRAYAEAIADGQADINRCPPGGAEGIARLAAISGHALSALEPECGSEGPRALAVIEEGACIGCTLCIQACPMDCIVGASKLMHTVIEALCTGCELCLPVCPVDCIVMTPIADTRTGWQTWSAAQADAARARYAWHQAREERDLREAQALNARLTLSARERLAGLKTRRAAAALVDTNTDANTDEA